MDFNKSIEEHEGSFWKEQDFPTDLVRRVFALRKKKLNELDESDLRLALGQEVGLPLTVPLVINILRNDILVDADFYPGDLLKVLIDIDASFWKSHYSLWQELNTIIESKLVYIHQFDGLSNELKDELLQRYLQLKTELILIG